MEDELINAGAEVVGPACSVEEALGLLAREAADSGLNAAVLDIGLDGEMVLPVADRLAYLGVPFIFATGYPEDHNRGLHTTAPTLEKPFDGNTLAGVVGTLIGGR